MLFSESSESITITKGVLSAQCKRTDQKTSIQSSISLNDYIGNVGGKLTWGGRGFIHTAEDIHVINGVLTAKLKDQAGKVVESKLDLNRHIQNTDGVLELIPHPHPVDVKTIDIVKASAPDLVRGISTASTASEASIASASSMFSTASSTSVATSVSTSSVKQSSSSSSSQFSSSQFRTSSKHLLIQDTCTKLELKGTFLHVECHRLNGSIAPSHIDLDEIIGFVNGHLEWDLKGFSKHCFEFALDGFFLVVKYREREAEQYRIARLDLRNRLRNADGVLIIIELNKKLSVMLSEVPWMKFKVIAEPDLSVFAKHPVMQETLTRIAESTVEHVTIEMHKKLTIAMEAAIAVVTASAMSHVSSQMETLVQDAVGYASASASITAAESLHLYGAARGGVQGYASGGYGYAASNGYGAGYAYAGGYSNGQSHASGHLEIHEHHQDGQRDSHSYAEIAKHAQVAHS